MLETIILSLFLLATAVQLFYFLYFFRKLAAYDPHIEEDRLQKVEEYPISVIICAKNEEENLKQNLPLILNQTDRSHSKMVVNDNSHDNSLYVLKKFPTFDIINLTNTNNAYVGKKYALSVGIKNASHNVLLLTDADCYPSSENWITRMRAGLGNKEIGLGYSPYTCRPGFLNLFIRYEAVWTAVQYLSFALAGLPYMGVGRNLIYKKELFERAGGFEKHKHIASGDDDLFINTVANADNTTIILHPETFVLSEPKTDWKSYIRQKRRHLSTGTTYQLKHQILLGLLSLSHFLHYTTGLVSVYYYDVTIFFTLFAVRMVVMMWVYYGILKRLGDLKIWFFIPFLDVIYLLFYLFFAPALMNTKNTWK